MFKKSTFLLVTLTLLFQVVRSQQLPFGPKINWVSGFQEEISGETLTYFSAFPDYVNQALLTRATDGNKAIIWKTAPVLTIRKGYAYFRWVAGHSTATSKGDRNFDVYINNEKALTFTTKPNNSHPNWSFASSDSTRITFVKMKNDGANDAHGIAYLRVPATRIKVGEPLELKIVGQKQNSNDWFMTFKYGFEEHADVKALPFLYKNGKQPLLINILHFGKEEKLVVTLNKDKSLNFNLKDGMNTFEIPIDAVKKTDSLQVLAKYGNHILANEKVAINPITFRELHFIHHSHTDIGYSHLQPEVERIHNKNIDDALLMIEKTKNYPAEAKFKWNVESLWVVENYLAKASELQKQKFFTAVKNGDICLSGLYANILTGLSMPEEMLHYTDYAQMLKQRYQLPIKSAMISDIPGYNWSMVTALAKGNIKYFSSGPNYMGTNNPYLGDRVGNMVKAWGDKPVWWTSPSGKEKVLFWAAGLGYSSWHGNAPGAVFENGAKKIANYLVALDAKNYPYEMVQWRYNIVADNAPIDTAVSDFVKQWNEKYASPKIILNTTDKLFEDFEKKHGAQLETVKGDITPYWEDGAASTAQEEGINRLNSLRLQQLTTLYSIVNPGKFEPDEFYEAWKNILLFHEHTWGAHNSISEPNLPFVTEQWNIKKKYMLTADEKIKALEDKLLPPVNGQNQIAVVNTLSWERNGPVYLPSNFTSSAVKDNFGKIYPTQKLADGRKVFIAKKLQPLSISYFSATNESSTTNSQLSMNDTTLTNGLISVIWDNKLGNIKQLTNIEGYSFATDDRNSGLNSYWYVAGRDPKDAATNLTSIKRIEENGPILITVSFTSKAPGANNITKKITLFAGDDKVLIEDSIDKLKIEEKEAVYFGFPFVHTLTSATADAGYGTLNYPKDQLPGANKDFISTKRWLDLSDADKGVQILMKEAFMVAPKMVDERLLITNSHKKWKDTAAISSTWFAYVMNNYWHTNYKAAQEGISNYNFALRPHGLLKNFEQEKAAMEFNQPLISFSTNEEHGLTRRSLFNLTNEKVVVTSITPKSDKEYLIRLFNPENNEQQFTINWQNLKPVSLSNMLTKEKLDPNASLKLAPLEIVEFLLHVN